MLKLKVRRKGQDVVKRLKSQGLNYLYDEIKDQFPFFFFSISDRQEVIRVMENERSSG